jgi:hypothetical protein
MVPTMAGPPSRHALHQHLSAFELLRAGAIACVTLAAGACGGFPKVNVEAYGATLTGEQGETIELTVALAHAPSGVVTVYAVSADETEGRVSNPVQFDIENWQDPRTMNVRGVDDTLDDGDVTYDVSVYASASWRTGEPDRLLKTLHFTNRDDDGASFEGLGDLPGGETASYVSDVNAAGNVVVGWSHGPRGEEAVRWTREHGLQQLGGESSRARAISPDGKLIVGSVAEPSYEGGRVAALWRGSEPLELLVGPTHPQSQQPLLWVVDGEVVLDDGRVFGTCIQYGAYGEPLACRFDGPGVVTTYHRGRVYAADAAGNFAGTLTSERHAPISTQAIYNDAVLPYPSGADCSGPSTGCLAEARDFSAAGSHIVGSSRVPEPGVNPEASPALLETAFAYAESTGALWLSNLDYGVAETGAYAISGDGRVIAGFGTDDRGQQAVAWVNGIPAVVEDILVHAGGTLPDGWQLFEIRAMSADLRTLVGNGSNPQGLPEGFRVVLPSGL